MESFTELRISPVRVGDQKNDSCNGQSRDTESILSATSDDSKHSLTQIFVGTMSPFRKETHTPVRRGTKSFAERGQSVKRVLLVALLLVALSGCVGQSDRCPDKCLCFRTTVRCMFVQLATVPEVPPGTTIL